MDTCWLRRVYRPVVAGSHHLEEELDPDLHRCEKLDPDLHSSDSHLLVLGIHDILMRIRIPRSVPLTNGSGSGSDSGSDSFLY